MSNVERTLYFHRESPSCHLFWMPLCLLSLEMTCLLSWCPGLTTWGHPQFCSLSYHSCATQSITSEMPLRSLHSLPHFPLLRHHAGFLQAHGRGHCGSLLGHLPIHPLSVKHQLSFRNPILISVPHSTFLHCFFRALEVTTRTWVTAQSPQELAPLCFSKMICCPLLHPPLHLRCEAWCTLPFVASLWERLVLAQLHFILLFLLIFFLLILLISVPMSSIQRSWWVGLSVMTSCLSSLPR